MKKFYMAPNAEITKFFAAEKLTADESNADYYVEVDAWGETTNPDGDVNN